MKTKQLMKDSTGYDLLITKRIVEENGEVTGLVCEFSNPDGPTEMAVSAYSIKGKTSRRISKRLADAGFHFGLIEKKPFWDNIQQILKEALKDLKIPAITYTRFFRINQDDSGFETRYFVACDLNEKHIDCCLLPAVAQMGLKILSHETYEPQMREFLPRMDVIFVLENWISMSDLSKLYKKLYISKTAHSSSLGWMEPRGNNKEAYFGDSSRLSKSKTFAGLGNAQLQGALINSKRLNIEI